MNPAMALVFAMIGAAFAAGQQPAKREVAYIQSLGGLGVEYRADLLFSAIASDKELLHSPVVVEALRDVYDHAGRARARYSMILAAPTEVDVMESQLSLAFRNERLDSLSIRTRALEALLASGSHSTYALARSLSVNPPSASCSDAMAYNVGDYYDFYAKAIPVWISDKEASSQDIEQQVQSQVSGASPASFASITDLLTKTRLPDDQVRSLSETLTSRELHEAITDRELGSLLTDGALLAHTDTLATRLESFGVSPYALFFALRSLLLSATRNRCADSLTNSTEVADSFNRLLAEHHISSNEMHLERAALEGPRIAGRSNLHPIDPAGTDDTSIKVLSRYSQRADKGAILQDISGWDSASNTLLQAVEHDNYHTECELCDFFRETLRYFLLADYSGDLPYSNAKERALRAFSDYMLLRASRDEDPVAWIFKFKGLLNLTRAEEPVSGKRIEGLRAHGFHLMGLPTPSGHVITEAIDSNDENISKSYVRFDRLFHSTYNSPY